LLDRARGDTRRRGFTEAQIAFTYPAFASVVLWRSVRAKPRAIPVTDALFGIVNHDAALDALAVRPAG